MGMISKTDYVTVNAVKNIASKPPTKDLEVGYKTFQFGMGLSACVEPLHVKRSSDRKGRLVQVPFVCKPGYGKTPLYLTSIKAQLAKANQLMEEERRRQAISQASLASSSPSRSSTGCIGSLCSGQHLWP